MTEKDRNPWLAGILTLLAVGLGHFYSGQAKRGFFLFFIGQGILLVAALPVIYYYPTIPVLISTVLLGFAFFFYCIFDAVRLSKRERYGFTLKRYNKWYVYLGYFILATFVFQPIVSSSIKILLIQAYKIPAGSLEPTILMGDQILARKLLAVKQGINRGDMVIFPFPEDTSKDFIKRVVALGGETIEIVNKKVFINGNLVKEPYVVHTDHQIIQKNSTQSMQRDNFGPVTVPKNAVFVMGDNRDQSYDSRFWGFVEKSAIKGKAYTIYWSWDKENYKVRWNRIGKKVE
ncbi:MAG: signal peptidase I [Deltaproteobacteria bacterium]|nr:signal peptidase I [Deltaproteobacteria bacterium]